MDERVYWLGFSAFSGIGPKRFAQLLRYFGSAKDAWKTDVDDLLQADIGEVLAKKFVLFRDTFDLSGYVQSLQTNAVSYVTISDETYPSLLRGIINPPFVLYGKGEREDLRFTQNDSPRIGVVGTRKVTSYGSQVTEQFTAELVQAGCVIVSGLAMGVDAIAHRTTVENDGLTIAVLGSGVDVCYPSSNQLLYNDIISSKGCVVSEYPLGAAPSVGSFPSRNRIIAGLSQAILVTEGAADSGALITAEFAMRYNRPVFAVPGPITSSLSKGPYKLIAKGAKLVTSTEDILNELGIVGSKSRRISKNIKGDTEEEQKIIDLLQNESMQFDEIVIQMKIDSSRIGVLLSFMEMKGVVKSLDGGFYSL